MPFKTWIAGVLTAADMNTYVGQQVITTCTSGTRPSSPVTGQTIYETDTTCYVVYNGSAWVHDLGGTWRTYTPTITNVTIGNGSVTGRYTVIGRTVIGSMQFFAGSTTSYAAGTFSVSLPIATAAWYGTSTQLGTGAVQNGTGASRRLTAANWATSTTFNQVLETTSGFVTNVAPFTFGTSAVMTVNFTYER